MGLRGIAAVIAVLAMGCAQTGALRGGGPRPAGWVEARSPHFTLATDLPADRARAALESFERVFTLFATRLFPSRDPPDTQVEVVMFATPREYETFRPRPYGSGYFSDGNDIVSRPTIVLVSGGFDEATRLPFQHELAHRFIHHFLPDPPVWLNEGLADYYSTASVYRSELYLGLPPRVPGSEPLPTLHALLAMGRAAFYDPKRALGSYLGAWALVHFLRNSTPDRARRFDRYFAALDAGARHERAWQDAFGDLDPAELESAFSLHVAALRRESKVWRSPWQEPPAPPVVTRRLDEAEARLVWVRVRPRGKAWAKAIEADLGAALAARPRPPEAEFWDGWMHQDEAALRRAVAARPQEERYRLALTNLLFARAEATKTLPSIEPEMRALFRVAHSPEALNSIAWYFALRELPDQGLPFARRALERDPSCWECLDTWALLSFQRGAFADAVAMQARAIELVPEGSRVPPEMNERLAKFRAAAAGAAAPSAAAPPKP